MPCQNTYTCISKFGCAPNSAITNPLTYSINETLDQKMLHGSSAATIVGQYSKNSQIFLANYCANNWDGFCEIASLDDTISYANNMDALGLGKSCMGLSQGDMLILNTARVKYLVDPGNKILVKEPYDPNVADSPEIYYWQSVDCDVPSASCGTMYGSNCGPSYAVNPQTVDNDIVMNKILCNPQLYISFLKNIYVTMTRQGTISQLNGTKLGNYFSTYQFQYYLK